MEGTKIEAGSLATALLALLDEAYLESPDPRGTWFTDNEPANGFLGTAARLSAAEASRPLTAGEGLSLASHVGHLTFALDLANRAAKGENPYPEAKWARSWDERSVDEADWRALLAGLRAAYAEFRGNLERGAFWGSQEALTGVIATIAHGAWHLGAIRQGLGLIRAPR